MVILKLLALKRMHLSAICTSVLCGLLIGGAHIISVYRETTLLASVFRDAFQIGSLHCPLDVQLVM